MLASYARLVFRHRGWFIAAAVVSMAAAGWYGSGVFNALSSGGFNDPGAESSRAAAEIAAHFGGSHDNLYVLLGSSNEGADSPVFAAAAKAAFNQIKSSPGVGSLQDYYSSGLPQLVSRDRNETYAIVGLSGSPDQQSATAAKLQRSVYSRELTVRFGGQAAINAETDALVKNDLKKAEMITFPISAALLVIIFRSLVAALLPLLIGVYGVLGAFVITRLTTYVTPISSFAINIITLLGLGLAIDYSLLIVSRFRDELAAGKTPREALATTQATAGKTVMFSAVIVMGSLAGLTVFPIGFLRSMGIGGSAAVLVAALGATFLLPPLLAALGHRVNWLSWGRLLPQRWQQDRRGGWSRIVRAVTKHPAAVVGATLALLLAAGSPILHLHLASPDFRALPASSQSRQVAEELLNKFNSGAADQIQIVIQADHSLAIPQTSGFTNQVQNLPGVNSLSTQIEGQYALITVSNSAPPDSPAAKALVRQIRALPVPPGWTRSVGGNTAEQIDLVSGILHKLPYAGAIIFGLVLILFFLLLGSLVIPLKTLIINALSLLAVFGTLVWIFQDGYLSGILAFSPLRGLDPTQPILVFALAFGLSMDYAVFLFSRIKEHFDTHADTPRAIAWGVQMTGGIISSAALLLLVVIAAFAAGQVTLMKEVGIGLIVAVLLDVIVVRLLLVPASMRLFGRFNWWAPPVLKRWHERWGIKEY